MGPPRERDGEERVKVYEQALATLLQWGRRANATESHSGQRETA